jgi:hypothetical protein
LDTILQQARQYWRGPPRTKIPTISTCNIIEKNHMIMFGSISLKMVACNEIPKGSRLNTSDISGA